MKLIKFIYSLCVQIAPLSPNFDIELVSKYRHHKRNVHDQK